MPKRFQAAPEQSLGVTRGASKRRVPPFVNYRARCVVGWVGRRCEVCPRCGFRAEGEAAFCARCGARIGGEPERRGSPRYVPSASSRTLPVNRLAAASIVLAVAWVWGIGSLLAVIYGATAKRSIDRSRGRVGGGGIAVTAIVLGCVGLVCVALVFLR